MNQTPLRCWWLLALRGTIAILFGATAILWPAMTLITLATLFAVFALLAGALWIFDAIGLREGDGHWWMLLMLGALSVAVGVIASSYPGLTAVVLILLAGANALVLGVLNIVVALRVRKFIRREPLLLVSGAGSALFGLFVLLFPTGAGALALAWMIGVYAITTGAMLLALALQVRSLARLNAGRSSPPAKVS